MRSRGVTLKRIANALTERGVPTKTGKSNRWTHQAVARILARPTASIEPAWPIPLTAEGNQNVNP